jgi:hypothetical protein
MMKMKINTFFGIFLVLFLNSCGGRVSQSDLTKLNGYWEISKVEMPDGSTKDYSINPTVDYLEIKDKKGFRKKVAPQYDGTYLINDHVETLKVVQEDDVFIIEYKTEYATWKEKILHICDEELALENENQTIYYYKRQPSFDLNASN